VSTWNYNLKEKIDKYFSDIKSKYLKENSFFAAIKLKVDLSIKSIFAPPSIKKKEIPQAHVLASKEFSAVPILTLTIYNHILKVIYDFGKSMERKPSTYFNKDEEGLRDQFLLILETRTKMLPLQVKLLIEAGKRIF